MKLQKVNSTMKRMAVMAKHTHKYLVVVLKMASVFACIYMTIFLMGYLHLKPL